MNTHTIVYIVLLTQHNGDDTPSDTHGVTLNPAVRRTTYVSQGHRSSFSKDLLLESAVVKKPPFPFLGSGLVCIASRLRT